MRKGFTLIELLAVIVILAIIALIATPLIINVIDESRKGAFKNTAYGIANAAELKYAQDLLSGTNEEVTFTYTDGVESSSPSGKSLEYKGAKPQSGTVKVNSEGQVALAIHNGTYCAEKGYNDNDVTLSDKTTEECVITVTYTYYNETKGVNSPVITAGMTPVKWNGTAWVNTTEDDPEWYSYTTTDKKWANAKTADGSFWVWIPRYAYSITSGYHTSTTGTIEVKFLIDDTNTTSDETTIEETPTYSGDSQTNYIAHPAFTFGSDELPGIWVAKFEASNDGSNNIKIIPNVSSWRTINVADSYTNSRNMETNSVYGWGTTGIGIDTHLMKNVEWGSVAYLAQSTYGKNAAVWTNPNNAYTTGCAGDSVSATSTASCNTYETAFGQEASTTGNVYGIYDMSGGSFEYTMGNFGDNAASGGITDVSSIPDKYIDRYTSYSDQYIGDATYETSLESTGKTSWYGSYSDSFRDTFPWFAYGGSNSSGTGSGIFSFYYYAGGMAYGSGGASSYTSFRPVLLIDSNL